MDWGSDGLSFVRFDLPPSPAATPVEIYDSDLALRARILSSEQIELAPGRYHVVARLPAGVRLRANIEVTPGQPHEIRLGASEEHYSLGLRSSGTPAAPKRREPRRPRGSADELRSSDSLAPPRPSRVDRLPPQPRRLARGKGKHGGEWQLWREPERKLPLLFDSSLVGPSVELRLVREPAPPQFSTVPAKALRYLRPSAAVDGDGQPRLTSRLRHYQADAVMGYLNDGQVFDAGLLADGLANQAEELLASKKRDPVAAAAGAFALLTLGEVTRLRDWTANLNARFVWLPDGAVAYAEHLALTGDHELAAGTLRQLAVRGLPCLTVALMTAVNRTSIYVAADLGGDELRALSQRLTRYVLACDLTATVTSFTAFESAEPLARAPSPYGPPTTY